MNNIIKIYKNSLRRLKIGVIVSLLCGIATILLYYSGKGTADMYYVEGSIDVGYICAEDSAAVQSLEKYLTEKVNMNLVRESKKILTDKLINTDISAIIEVPDGFQAALLSRTDVMIKSTTLDDYENAAYVTVYLDGFMNSAKIAAAASGGDDEIFEKIIEGSFDSELVTQNAVVTSREAEYADAGLNLAMGMSAMLMGLVGIFITVSVTDDKNYYTYNRMKISAVTSAQYVIGTSLSALTMSLFASLILPFNLLITGEPIQVPIINIFIACILFSMFISGFSILIALLIKSKEALYMLSGAISSIGCILGGCYFPLDDSIGAIKVASMCVPHYWFVEVVRNETDNPVLYLCVIALFALIMFLGCSILFSKRTKD